MKVGIMVVVSIRMEMPFVQEWLHYQLHMGVQKVWVGLDTFEGKWSVKPNERYYCREQSRESLERILQDAIHSVAPALEVDLCEVPHFDDISYTQLPFFKEAAAKAAAENFDWILNCDIDEYVITSRHRTYEAVLTLIEQRCPHACVVKMRQYLFDSRWDAQTGFKPRSARSIKRYNPDVVEINKYFYNPKRAAPTNVHKATPLDNGDVITAPLPLLHFHHYRGVEKAGSRMGKIQDFPNEWGGDLIENSRFPKQGLRLSDRLRAAGVLPLSKQSSRLSPSALAGWLHAVLRAKRKFPLQECSPPDRVR